MLKSKIFKWYYRHDRAIQAILETACRNIPGGMIVQDLINIANAKKRDAESVEVDNKLKKLECLLGDLKAYISDFVEDVEDLEDFQKADDVESSYLIIKNSYLINELNELIPHISQSIQQSISNFSEHKEFIINNKYSVLEKIGSGGQGDVYRGMHLLACNPVAIKFIPHEVSRNKTYLENLANEYKRLVNILRHPNIVQYRDLEQDQKTRRWFIVMDYIEGENLRKTLLRKKLTNKIFSVQETIEILIPIAKALSFSHGNNIVHCDLKPENILIEEKSKQSFLTDFGLSYEIKNSLSIEEKVNDSISGTLPYMAPEQYKGQRVRKATDLWAMGIIFYEMVEGCHPFNGRSFDHYQKIICSEKPEKPKQLSNYQWGLLLRLLDKDYRKRPQNLEETLNLIANKTKKVIEKKSPSTTLQVEKKNQTLLQVKIKNKNQKSKDNDSLDFTNIPGFLFLQEKSYSCGNKTHVVKEYIHKKTRMEFVLIPDGYFDMGSDDVEAKNNEKPMHSVYVHSFLMAKYVVTQEVWSIMMGNNPSDFKGDKLPVEQVNWSDCKKFCDQFGMRLPGEAEWEYACCANSNSKYYWGNSMDGNYAWYSNNSGNKTHNVGEKLPNAFGLYDMIGNVWEWCNNWYGNYSNKSGEESNILRVVRGGGWGATAKHCRSTFRSGDAPGNRSYDLGFRPCFSEWSTSD